jgi:hypothetical protein
MKSSPMVPYRVLNSTGLITEDLLLLPVEVGGLGQCGHLTRQEEGLVDGQQGLVQGL